MLGCQININLNGEVKSFNSQEELDDFIKNNFNRINSVLSGSRNVRFSKSADRKSEVAQLLLDFKLEKGLKKKYDTWLGDTYEVITPEFKKKIPKSKGVTTLLNELTDSRGEKIFQEFDVDNYRKNTISQLIESKKLSNPKRDQTEIETEAIKEVEATIASWPNIATLGTASHGVADLFFETYEKDFSKFYALYVKRSKGELTQNAVMQLHKVFSKYHDSLLAKDPEMQFFTEVPMYDEESGIVGVVDFIAVDSKGMVHVADFKTSSKYVFEQDRDKIGKYRYQLAFYKRMLESKGITVASTTIVPIKMNPQDDTYAKLDSVEAGELLDMTPVITDPLSDENITAKNYIKVDDTLNTLRFDNNSVINEEQKAFFNLSTDDSLEHQYEQFLKRNVYREGNKKFFRDEAKGKKVYLKDINPDPRTQKEIDERDLALIHNKGLIMNYILTNNNSKYEYTNAVKNSIRNGIMRDEQSVREGELVGEYIDPFSKRLATTAKEKARYANSLNAFSHYYNGQWEVLDVPELEAEGIIAFKNNVGNFVEFVAITSDNLNTVTPLSKGTSLVGEFRSNRRVENEHYKLENTTANQLGIKILSFLNGNVDLFAANGLTVNTLRVFNYNDSTQEMLDKERLIDNYKILAHETGREFNLNKLSTTSAAKELLSAVDMAFKRQSFRDTGYTEPERRVISSLNELLGKSIGSDKELVAELRKIKKFFESRLDMRYDRVDHNSELGYVYSYVNDLITELTSGRKLNYQRHDMKAGLAMTDSVMFTSFQEVRNETARIALQPLRAAMFNLRDEYTKHREIWHKKFKEFYDKKGVSTLLGNHQGAFKNLFERDENGELDKAFRFKNPDKGGSDYLDDTEREFLRDLLETMNSYLYDNDLDIEKAKAKGTYYNVPLKRASSSSKFQEKPSSLLSKPKTFIDNFVNAATQENFIFEEQHQEVISMADEMSEMWNNYTATLSPDIRQTMLDGNDLVEFEKNIEDVFEDLVFSAMRKEKYDEALPLVTAAMVSSSLKQRKLGNFELKNAEDYIKKYVKSVIFKEKLVEPEETKNMRRLSALRHGVSMLQLGGPSLNIIRETLQGQWGAFSKLSSKKYGEGSPSFKDYTKAISIIIGESGDFLKNVTMTEELNHKYGMANLDINSLAEKMRISKTGVTQFNSRWLLWMMGAPDYLNRMSFFVSKLIKDGAYEAHTFEDGKLRYDWTKDERFKEYAAGNKDHPEYEKQRGLYLAYLKEFNNDNLVNDTHETLVEGDALPKAYPAVEIDSIKQFSNYMYGPYDEEDKILSVNTLYGSLLLQFRTWMLGKKQQYYTKHGTQSIGAFEHLKDPATGKGYYVKDGEINTEGIGTPLMEWRGRYMEGILQSIQRLGQDIFRLDGAGLKEDWSNPDVRANMQMLGTELGILMSIMLAFGAIDWGEMEKDNRLFYSVADMVRQSPQDLNPITGLRSVTSGDQIPVFGYLWKNFDAFAQVLFGDKSWQTAITNLGGSVRFVKQTTNLLDVPTSDGE